MNIKELDLKKVSFPKKAEKIDYFKAAVLYIIKDGALAFYECKDNEESTFDDAMIKSILKQAVPGYNSVLLNMEIMCHVNDSIIENKNLDLRRKISSIADSIEKYVVL